MVCGGVVYGIVVWVCVGYGAVVCGALLCGSVVTRALVWGVVLCAALVYRAVRGFVVWWCGRCRCCVWGCVVWGECSIVILCGVLWVKRNRGELKGRVNFWNVFFLFVLLIFGH